MKIKRSEAHGLSGGGDARLLPTSIAPRLAGASRLGVLLSVDPAFPSRFQRILPSCSSVRLLTQSTHARALAISYQPCTPRGAGNVKTSTRSPSAPRGFTARGQGAGSMPGFGHVAVCLHHGTPSSTKGQTLSPADCPSRQAEVPGHARRPGIRHGFQHAAGTQ